MASVRVISKLTGRWAPTGLLALFFGTSAAAVARDRTWRDCLAEDADWYRSAEAVRIADNILYYQAEIGGWYKNCLLYTSDAADE